jgi:3-dehydroquinate synthetase
MAPSCVVRDDLSDKMLRRRIGTTLTPSYDVILSPTLLDANDTAPRLPNTLTPRAALLVTTPTVMHLYGQRVAEAFRARGFRLETLVLDCTERTKTLKQVTRVCRAALAHRLDRSGALIALGGGVCLDVVTVAASWIRRGITCLRVPTTLIGQIDAGLGVKGAVNFRGHKSYVGCFYAPEATLLDPSALRTLPKRHLQCGIAEMLKIALIRDEPLFRLIERHATDFIASGFQTPALESLDAVWRAAVGMLDELEPNLYENVTNERFVDMGHTFSPLVEAASGFQIAHGEAVAIDLALSTALAIQLGWLAEADGEEIIRAVSTSGLPIDTPLLTPGLCAEALAEAGRHRRRLVLPRAIGKVAFVEADSPCLKPVLGSALDWLRALARGSGAPAGPRRRVRPPLRMNGTHAGSDAYPRTSLRASA